MKLLRILILFVFSCTFAYGQAKELVYGLKAGINYSNMVSKNNNGNIETGFKAGLLFGGTVDYLLTKKILLQSGLIISGKGCKYIMNTIKVKLNYLEIPVNVLYKLKIKPLYIILNGGPYVGLAAAGKYKAKDKIFGTTENPSNKSTINFGTGKNDKFRRFDFGFNTGAGVEYNSIYAGLQFGFGLFNVAANNDNGAVDKNYVFSISFGYKF
jgi:hypothetical protein